MRFFDEISRCRKALGFFPSEDVVVIDGSNVYSGYVNQLVGQEIVFSDIPNVAPPFNRFFIEVKSSGIGPLVSWGVYFEVQDGMIPCDCPERHAEVRWSIWANLFCKSGGGYLCTRPGCQCNGKAVSKPGIYWEDRAKSVHFVGHDGKLLRTSWQNEDLAEYAGTQLVTSFFVLSFMHCKNVTRVEHVPDAALQKATVKRHGIPLTRYYTLQIDPMKEVLRREGGVEQTGLKKALHICRGHFSTYSEERPLFGRVAGTFWVPQHVRGSKEHGQVVKDYAVSAPAVVS